MPLSVFCNRPSLSKEPDLWKLLKEVSENGAAQPVSFFCIKGSKDDSGNFSFSTTNNSVIVKTAATKKGKSLVAEASSLLGLADTESFVVRQYEEGVARDFGLEPGTETMCALFGVIANTPTTGVDSIDDVEETLWQLNWVRVEEPPAGSNIRTNDGKRLWFPVTVRDSTGKLTMYIQESAALKLSGILDAEQFEAAFVDGKLWFPQMASVKILRRLKPSAAQPGDQQDRQLDVRIVDAAFQNLGESPTEDSARLLRFLNSDLISTDIVLPAALHMLRKSPHYTLAVESAVPTIPDSLQASFFGVPSAANVFRPCTQALALVESSQASTLAEAGEGGYKIITNGVKDLLNEDPDSPACQLTSFCSLNNLQDFKLDPPRTRADKKQAALVLISAVLQAGSAEQPASYMVDSVQLLQQSEVEFVKVSLKRLLFLTVLAGHMASRKRTLPFPTNEESPAKASKCRALGRHPTAAAVPQF